MRRAVSRLLPAAALSFLSIVSSPAQPAEDRRLQDFFHAYLEENFRRQPTAATALGDHRYDARLDDISPAARAGWGELARRTLEELPRAVDFQRLSRDGQIDFEVLRNELAFQLWTATQLRPFETDPRTYGRYLNDSVYALVAQSTAPKETNVANTLARLAEMPRILAEARRSLTRPAAPVLETAIRQNLGAIAFYESELLSYVGQTSRRDELAEAAAKVADALREHQTFLESLRERADPEWRLGRDRFAEKFAFEIGAAVTPEQNLADAEAEFTRVHQELHVIARQLWPRYFPDRVPPPDDPAGRLELVRAVTGEVNREHPDAAGLLTAVRATVADLKTFITKHGYLRLPEPDRCSIIEMPEFRRGNSLAYMENSPPLDPEGPSYYAVSPPPADWTEEQKRSFLEEYNGHMLKILTLHEAYPGHYVQLEYANRHPSLIRRVLQSGSYIEGWAVYNEVSMLDAGYGDGDLRLRLMQLKFYLRAVVNSILDYKMHCTAMTDDEAMRLLVDGAFQSEGEAKLKVIRAKQSSVQLSTYFVGRMAHYRLRQSIQHELGDAFDLGRYHEAVLGIGSVPPKYMPELVRLRLARPR